MLQGPKTPTTNQPSHDYYGLCFRGSAKQRSLINLLLQLHLTLSHPFLPSVSSFTSYLQSANKIHLIKIIKSEIHKKALLQMLTDRVKTNPIAYNMHGLLLEEQGLHQQATEAFGQ